ncbi:hypothetical protein EV421DRAFT_2023688 [Armillaria borealis]|uniref:Uncharacterized protein n=1 Tax=Armillaria borealis TaxID=47425 RepID=A0AA39IYT5_9AGAR|nr:hypothetical protein EV421DRAFT_2023688 [Armillaria borealis]
MSLPGQPSSWSPQQPSTDPLDLHEPPYGSAMIAGSTRDTHTFAHLHTTSRSDGDGEERGRESTSRNSDSKSKSNITRLPLPSPLTFHTLKLYNINPVLKPDVITSTFMLERSTNFEKRLPAGRSLASINEEASSGLSVRTNLLEVQPPASSGKSALERELTYYMRPTLPSALYLETAALTKIPLGYISTISLFQYDTLQAHLRRAHPSHRSHCPALSTFELGMSRTRDESHGGVDHKGKDGWLENEILHWG